MPRHRFAPLDPTVKKRKSWTVIRGMTKLQRRFRARLAALPSDSEYKIRQRFRAKKRARPSIFKN